MYICYSSQTGHGKLDYQLGVKTKSGDMYPKKATVLSGSPHKTRRTALFLETIGIQKQTDEITLGCKSPMASNDFSRPGSTLWSKLEQLISRGHPEILLPSKVSVIRHAHNKLALDAHINVVAFVDRRNVSKSLLTTTKSDDLIKRYFGSHINHICHYPDPDDPENHRLYEHFRNRDENEYAYRLDNVLSKYILNGKINSYEELKQKIKEMLGVPPIERRKKNGQVVGLQLNHPQIQKEPIIFRGRKYAGSLGFDEVLARHGIQPSNRRLQTRKKPSVEEIVSCLKYRNLDYKNKLTKPPHNRFSAKIDPKEWNNLYEILTSNKLYENPKSKQHQTVQKLLNNGKHIFSEKSTLPKLYLQRRDNLQIAYAKFKKEQRVQKLIENFERNLCAYPSNGRPPGRYHAIFNRNPEIPNIHSIMFSIPEKSPQLSESNKDMEIEI